MQVTDAQTCARSVQQFTAEVDVSALWCPDNVNYDTWICQLLCCLIGSGSVHNELFQLLSPVCHIKVRAVQFLFSTSLKCSFDESANVIDC